MEKIRKDDAFAIRRDPSQGLTRKERQHSSLVGGAIRK